MNELPERVGASIFRRGLLRRGQAVLLAVSGGVDSMVLLHVLHELSVKQNWRLTIAHLNHQLRGRSSDADERLVVRTARRMGLPCVVERADIKSLAQSQKLSVEMAARQVRHQFLAKVASRSRIRTVALAHHADDQIELFFLRLFRGSGGEGLAGMKWRNASPADSRIQLIRPLLNESKAALLVFARERKIQFREDATNASLEIQRNRIRRELLPLLRRKYQPALDRAVARAMEITAEESEFVAAAAREWLFAKRPLPFDKLPIALQRRCVQLQLIEQNIAADFDLIERLRTLPDCRVSVGPDCAIALDQQGRLRQFSHLQPAQKYGPTQVKFDGETGNLIFGGIQIRWSIFGQRSSIPIRSHPGREIFDADKVGEVVNLRHWRPGDRFQPSGMPGPVKLQDLFVNQKIARERRRELVVATTAAGEIFWVQQLRIAERFKLRNETIRSLQWRWKPL